jgi:hypothetical protein
MADNFKFYNTKPWTSKTSVADMQNSGVDKAPTRPLIAEAL